MRTPCLIWLGTVSAVTHDVIRRVGQRCSGKSTVILSGKCQGKVLSDRKRVCVCVSVPACVGWCVCRSHHVSKCVCTFCWLDPVGGSSGCNTFHDNTFPCSCPLDWCVFVCFMLQSQCHLIRSSPSTHPSYPHTPPGRRSSPGSAAAARCCFISLTPGIDGAYSRSSIAVAFPPTLSHRRFFPLS